MEKEVKFEVGKWYKNLGIFSQKNTFGKFLKLCSDNKEFWASEFIYNGKFHSGQGWLDFSSETVEIDIEEIQQYLPDGHPDKIKSNGFKVGDWVVWRDGYIDTIKKHYYSYSDSWYLSEKYNSCSENVLRHATQDEVNKHLISLGQIPEEKYPFKKLEEDDLTWEIETKSMRWTEPALMTKDNWKHKMILSIDDEELPMVSIIKTNTVKQLLNND